MEQLKNFAIHTLAIATVFHYRATILRSHDSLPASFLLGLATSYFCLYILPLRFVLFNPGNIYTIDFTKRRLKYAKIRAAQQHADGKVDREEIGDMYGLEHVFMNLDLQPRTMWESIGYWKDAGGSFTKACTSLWELALKSGGVLDHGPVSILELGCGCAEAALYLLNNNSDQIASYVGLNINGPQTRLCETRLEEWKAGHAEEGPTEKVIRAFQADAARPSTWSEELTQNVNTAMLKNSPSPQGHSNRWLVAIDSMYHFRGGREAILTHGAKTFGTSLIAADFVKVDKLTTIQRWLLYLTLDGLQIPWKTTLTRQEYIEMLVRCGYDRDSIRIADITEHVFTNYADFMAEKRKRWEEIGGSVEAVRPFTFFGWVMRYWGWAGTLRSIVVVAHPKR